VRERPNGTFYAELRAGGQRFGLGTYDTAHEAARAYDAAAWRAGRNPRTMNFRDARNAEQAAELAPPTTLLTAEQRRRHQQQRRLDIAASDERAMEAWRREFPQDIIVEVEFYARRKEERRAARELKRARKRAAEALLGTPAGDAIDEEHPLWNDLWTDTSSSGSDWEE
jgi:hypothetical protein